MSHFLLSKGLQKIYKTLKIQNVQQSSPFHVTEYQREKLWNKSFKVNKNSIWKDSKGHSSP